MYITQINNTLSIRKNNNQANNQTFCRRFPNGVKHPKHVKEFIACKDFARYNPIRRNFGNYVIPVHNEGIGKYLKQTYTSEQFSELFNFTKQKGTFDYIMDDKSGFIKTSIINRKENTLMSDMIWITDTCNNMILVKSQHPQDCTKVLNKMADLYEGQKDVFEQVISMPSIYKKNPIHVWLGQIGAGHCFDPKTHKPHIWFPKTRLESIGNYLQQACDIITTGFEGGKYGYKTANEIPQNVIDSIANCCKYLKSINYPKARSCGNWEEDTFMSSLTSDTSICNQAIRDVIKLMFKPSKNEEVQKFRARIINAKHGDIFANKKDLESLLREGSMRKNGVIKFAHVHKPTYLVQYNRLRCSNGEDLWKKTG